MQLTLCGPDADVGLFVRLRELAHVTSVVAGWHRSSRASLAGGDNRRRRSERLKKSNGARRSVTARSGCGPDAGRSGPPGAAAPGSAFRFRRRVVPASQCEVEPEPAPAAP
jgi:hypothetical protein